MAVYVKSELPAARSLAPAVRADAYSLMRLLGLSKAELSAVLTGDAPIRRLNREFRGKDAATDVLSFPQFDSLSEAQAAANAAPAPLGDIVISIETAARQAAELRIETLARVRTLLIHGLLHLLGYDHERSAADARRMYARERVLAAAIASGGERPNGGAGVGHHRNWPPAAMPPASARHIAKAPRARARAH